jgi:hypothetical protein
MQPETFRKEREQPLIGQVVEQLLRLCLEQRMRTERVKLEQRHQADTRIAVQWLDRFEAYYRIWTPVSRLGDDLQAAITTRQEPDTGRPPWDPEGASSDSQDWQGMEDQAQGYVRGALYAYAWFQLELRRFVARHGGLWIFNVEDDSWLRRLLSQTQYEEELSFMELLRASSIGPGVLQEWLEFAASCQCQDPEHPQDDCRVHCLIKACESYCRLVDEEWYKIADWYHPDSKPRRPTTGAELYDKLLADQARLTGRST